MPLTILPALSSDLEDVHRFQLSVDAQGPIGRLAFPNGASDVSVVGYVERSRKCISDPTSTLRRVLARDSGDTGGVISYALWSFVQESQAEIKTTDAGGLWSEWPGDVMKEVLAAWIGMRKTKREEIMRGKPHACRWDFFFLFFLFFLMVLDFTEIPALRLVRFLKIHSSILLLKTTSN